MAATAVSAAKCLTKLEMFNYEKPTADHEFIGQSTTTVKIKRTF